MKIIIQTATTSLRMDRMLETAKEILKEKMKKREKISDDKRKRKNCDPMFIGFDRFVLKVKEEGNVG